MNINIVKYIGYSIAFKSMQSIGEIEDELNRALERTGFSVETIYVDWECKYNNEICFVVKGMFNKNECEYENQIQVEIFSRNIYFNFNET